MMGVANVCIRCLRALEGNLKKMSYLSWVEPASSFVSSRLLWTSEQFVLLSELVLDHPLASSLTALLLAVTAFWWLVSFFCRRLPTKRKGDKIHRQTGYNCYSCVWCCFFGRRICFCWASLRCHLLDALYFDSCVCLDVEVETAKKEVEEILSPTQRLRKRDIVRQISKKMIRKVYPLWLLVVTLHSLPSFPQAHVELGLHLPRRPSFP